jgi:photosystem II stability/assembly factor-like uncharacterized protein
VGGAPTAAGGAPAAAVPGTTGAPGSGTVGAAGTSLAGAPDVSRAPGVAASAAQVASATPDGGLDPESVAGAPVGAPSRSAGDPPSLYTKKPFLRELYFWAPRALPDEDIPDRALLRARQQLDQRVRSGALPTAPQGASADGARVPFTESPWTAIGPAPIGSGLSGSGVGTLPYIGRVAALAVADANTVYLGSASGGVWKTTNGGTNWTPKTDNQSSLAIGALAIDPTNPNTVYAGLGEQNFSGSSYYGFGVLKSTNGGDNWTLLPAGCNTNTACIFSRQRIGRIAVDPNNPQIVYAATTNGIARSNDGGQNWTTVYLPTAASSPTISDVVIDDTTNPSTVYAAHGSPSTSTAHGVYQTTTNLAHASGNWTKLLGTAPNTFPTTDVGRIRLTFGVANRGTPAEVPTLYAVVHNATTQGLMGVWRTIDDGATWTATPAHPESAPGTTGFSICSQCWYDLNVTTFPTDPNHIYVQAVEMFKSANGGASWTLISNGYAGPPFKLHVDQHAFGFIPGNSSGFYAGNDGGVYKSLDGGASFTNLNQSLAITQFWRGTAHPTNGTSAFGGTQDNGSLSYENSTNWFGSLGGDGGYAAVDYNTPSTVYASTQELNIRKSTNGPRGTFLARNSGINNAVDGNGQFIEPRQFIAPIAMDPTTPTTLYAGTTRLYRTTNGATNWSPISNSLASANSSFNAISAIGVSKSASNTIYVGTGTSTQGAAKLWVTTDASIFTDRTAGLPNRTITSIAVHPTDPNTAYVTVSGFNTGHVWKTINAGQNWVDVSGTLPNVPVNSIVVDPSDGQNLYVGTDVGVFKSINGAGSWSALNAGLPNVVVMDLVLNRAGTHLFAFTHGRGAFVASRTPAAPSCAPRPNVGVAVAPASGNRLQVTVTANTGPGATTNALLSLAFGALDNAVVDIVGGQSNVTSNQTITLGPGVTSQQFFVRRTTGGVASTVPLVATDLCGGWPTFVGGGPSAF